MHRRLHFLPWLTLPLIAAACAPPEAPPPETEQAGISLDQPTEADAIRFLEQSSFGATAHGVRHVMAVGIPTVIGEQLAARGSRYSATSTHTLSAQFFERAVGRNDQLQQRVAFALSQILVVSQQSFNAEADRGQAAIAAYLNVLARDGITDFRTLLEDITLNAAMGHYLDMANNNAFNPDGTPLDPNENYARELLQLFSLGLYLLNDDGTVKLDAGVPRPAYTQAQVEALAHTLTGWTYAAPTDCPARGRRNPRGSWAQPMIGCDVNHDSSSQLLLRGFRTTAGAGAVQHLDEALDNIASHPNVAPFICKQLIQHLVTSNPSRGYVRRVVARFRDDGNHNVGNLAAVVRAILEDPEARGDRPRDALDASYGHLRSPVLLMTSVMRRLGAEVSDGRVLDTLATAMRQRVPFPPSVFSYYPPNQPLPGSTTLLGPEFAIADSASSFARSDFLNRLLFRSIPGVVVHLELVPTEPDAMVAWLRSQLLHGDMSDALADEVRVAVTDARVPTALRPAMGVYLAAMSPEYQIER